MSKDSVKKRLLELKRERDNLLKTRSIEPSDETLLRSKSLLEGYGTLARQAPKAALAVTDVIAAPLSIPLSLKTGKNWSPSGIYERAFDAVTGDRFKPTSKVGKIAEAMTDVLSPSATALKLPKVLEKIKGKHIPYVSKYIEKAHNVAKGTYHKSIRGVGAGTVGAGVGQHLLNEGESPLLALALNLGAGSATKAVGNVFKSRPRLKTLDALAIKAAEGAHNKASSAYSTLTKPIKAKLNEKSSIVLSEPVRELIEQYKAIKNPALQEYFLKSEAGKVLKELMLLPPQAPFSLFRHKVESVADDFGNYIPKGVTHTGVHSIYQGLNEKIGKMGGFDIGGKSAAVPLNEIRGNIKKNIDTAVGELGEDAGRKWSIANRLWERYKNKREPIVKEVLSDQHKRGSAFKAAVKDMAEGAENPRFIASQLRGEEQRQFARAAMNELSGSKALVDLTKGKFSSPTKWLGRKIIEITDKPPERKYFEDILASDPKFSNLLVSRYPRDNESHDDIKAKIKALKKEKKELLSPYF